MTVAELIALLQSCDPSSRVVVAGYENGFNDAVAIESVTIGPNADREWWDGEFEAVEGGEPAVFVEGTPREELSPPGIKRRWRASVGQSRE